MKKEKTKSTFWKDFKVFINRGNVVDMAIGVIVATAFKDIVTKFTSTFISPLVSFLTGGISLTDLKIVIRTAVTDADGAVLSPEVAVTWGAFIQAIVDFLIIAFVLFLLLRIFTRASKKTKELLLSKEEKEAAEKAAAEAKAKEEAEKAAAEAKAKEEADRVAAALAREEETVALLREIRDTLSATKTGKDT